MGLGSSGLKAVSFLRVAALYGVAATRIIDFESVRWPPRRFSCPQTLELSVRTHIKVVGLVNLAYSALGLLAAAGILFGGIFGGLASLNPIAIVIGTVTGAVFAAVVGVISGLGLVASFALLNNQNWARYALIVVSCFRLFRWPWGTAFAIYSLWVLTHEETRREFALGV